MKVTSKFDKGHEERMFTIHGRAQEWKSGASGLHTVQLRIVGKTAVATAKIPNFDEKNQLRD